MTKQAFFPFLCLLLALAAAAAPWRTAYAQQDIGSLYYYDVDKSEYYDAAKSQYNANYYQWRLFLEYNLDRKPCQHYQDPPEGYVLKDCHVYRAQQQVTSLTNIQPTAGGPEPAAAPTTIYFDFDKSNVRASETEKLNSLIAEIKDNPPAHVTIAGHTDTAGPVDYNIRLSERRAKVIADALIAQGVSKDIIEQKAYGKTDLAVPTADNVPLQENRRTVVIFVQ